MESQDISIKPAATADDLKTAQDLAEVIWHQHYPGIITHKQIRYMLDTGYAAEVLADDISRGVRLCIVCSGKQPIGVLAFGPIGKGCETKLHKLYVLQSFHGQGIGSMLLQHVEDECRRAECTDIHLLVNKHNLKAIRAYERAGLKIRKSCITAIGNGFFMDDFVMGKSLAATG
ncbi:MAG: GNAT family N-acetyltransferase [Pseudomonadales bacterium]|nr:GNAT family N-acetyltransferase [Pseudomonadales bacterium]